MKVLIIAPSPQNMGGVSEYYKLIDKYKQNSKNNIEFLYVNNEFGKSMLLKIYSSLKIYFKFIRIINKYDIVQINISIGWWSGMLRDIVFLFLAKNVFRKRTILFFHGWDTKREKIIIENSKIFKFLFKSDIYIVLANKFKRFLVELGIEELNIKTEITIFEETITPIIKQEIKNIIFIARFAKNKGCMKVLHIFDTLSKKNDNLKLYMVGDGEMMPLIVDFVNSHNLHGKVVITGYLTGLQKNELIRNCDVLLFPTEHSEGFPLSVVECMSQGLVIISNNSGGIPDIVINGVNGYLSMNNENEEYLNIFEELMNKSQIIKEISANNIQLANNRMAVNAAIKRFDNYYLNILK